MKLPSLINTNLDVSFRNLETHGNVDIGMSFFADPARLVPAAAVAAAPAAVANGCGPVGAAVTAGRYHGVLEGTFGSTGWHGDSKHIYGKFLKVGITDGKGRDCTCHVHEKITPHGCNYATCDCGSGINGYVS